jgi:hypothetical protein
MFAKVHPAKDVQSGNTGSCHDLVHYLQKEGDTGLAFFSHTDNDVSPEKVITDIDGNRSKLGSDEAKFYMLSLNPSQAEQVHLIGREVNSLEELTPEECQAVYRKLEKFTRSAMDEYARNFQREAVKDGGDLMYYARIETKRTFSYSDEEVKKGLAKIGDVKPGLNLHVHVVVSRKSKDGKVKLSPAAKSAGNSWELEGRGTVKRGFSHENWKVSVQQCFDREFQNVPDMVSLSDNVEFNLLLATDQYGVKASARFVKGKGQVYISGYDATRDEGVALEHNNLVVFMPESTGETLIEFTVSSRYGLPVRKQITIQVNP